MICNCCKRNKMLIVQVDDEEKSKLGSQDLPADMSQFLKDRHNINTFKSGFNSTLVPDSDNPNRKSKLYGYMSFEDAPRLTEFNDQ